MASGALTPRVRGRAPSHGAFGRVAIIGDVGGHHDELFAALVDLGMDPSSDTLPNDLTVVQVGDTIHRGPMSDEVVELIDSILRTQRDHWAQVLGNHEQLYVAEPVFACNETIADDAAQVLRYWWERGLMSPAVAVETGGADDVDWLITHAGLTVGFWGEIGSPTSAAAAAAAINRVDRHWLGALWRTGQMLVGGDPNLEAGPVWASSTTEMLPGWCGPRAPRPPFHQAYGHSCVADWTTGRPVRTLDSDVARATVVDVARRHVTTTARGRVIVGVDPCHDVRQAPHWAPLIIENARVVVR